MRERRRSGKRGALLLFLWGEGKFEVGVVGLRGGDDDDDEDEEEDKGGWMVWV